jgi:hypothetical protein
VSGNFLLNLDGRFLILYFGRSSVVLIDDSIEVISDNAFRIYDEFSTVEFGCESKLRRIESFAFSDCSSLQSICIPSFVDQIDGRAFARSGLREIRIAEGNRHFRVCGKCLTNSDGTALVRYFGRASDLTVIGAVEVVCSHAFSYCDLTTVRFERDSRLHRIAAFAFLHCSLLREIFLPPAVEMIDGSAFAKCDLREIRVDEENRHFGVRDDFLLSRDGHCLVRYLGGASVVRISRDIEIFSVGSFRSCKWVRGLEFETGSQLRCIGERAFDKCVTLYSICIPRSTECLCHFCFRKCDNLREVRFEAGSKLRRIESDTFSGCSSLRWIRIPMSLKGQEGVDVSGSGDVEIDWY